MTHGEIQQKKKKNVLVVDSKFLFLHHVVFQPAGKALFQAVYVAGSSSPLRSS